VPVAAGLAFAEKYKGTDNLAICFPETVLSISVPSMKD
jgi:hypothetical protein